MTVDYFASRESQREVFLADCPDEDRRVAFTQGLHVESGSFESFPADFEQKSLLRVHGQGLAWTDTEESGIKLVGIMKETAMATVGLAGRFRVGIIERLGIPVASSRKLRDGICAIKHQFPEILGRSNASWVATCHRNDRDGFPSPEFEFIQV